MLIYTEEQRQFADLVEEFLASEAPVSRTRVLRDAGQTHDEALWEQLVELGIPGILVAEEQGGLGLGMVEVAIAFEALGRHLVVSPALSAVLCAGLVDEPGALADGRVTALAWREHPRKADPAMVSVTRRDGQLFGLKQAVVDGQRADDFMVLGRDEAEGTGLYGVARDDPALQRQARVHIDHRDSADLLLNGAIATPRHVTTDTLRQAFDLGAIAVSAELLGIMARAFQLARAYLLEREQFGKKLGAFQALQHRAVDCYARITQARAVVLAAAQDPTPAHAALAYAWCSESAPQVCQEAIQFLGGIGMTDEHDIGLYLKRARVAAGTFGTASEARARWAHAHGY